jgi:hypothetical protein
MEWCSERRVDQYRASRTLLLGKPSEAAGGDTLKAGRSFGQVRAVCESPEVLVCKVIDNKVTYVHRRVCPALIKLAPRFRKERLAKVWDEHTKTGAHRSRQVPFPNWVPADVMKEAETLSTSEAERILSAVLPKNSGKDWEAL